MAFIIHIFEADREDLNSLPLSEAAKEKVEDCIEYAIAEVSDAFRNDPANRPRPDASYFQVEFLFFDEDTLGNRSYHKVLFVVNDARASVGILLLVYVEHQTV